MPHLNFFLLNHGKKALEKFLFFSALSGVSGRDENVDTITIAAENGPLKLVLTLIYTPTAQHLAAY